MQSNNKLYLAEIEACQEKLKRLEDEKHTAVRDLCNFKERVSKWKKRQQDPYVSQPSNSWLEIPLSMGLSSMLFLGFLGVLQIDIGDLNNILIITEDSVLPESFFALIAAACINVGEKLSVERHAEAFIKGYSNYRFYDSYVLKKIVDAVVKLIENSTTSEDNQDIIKTNIQSAAQEWIKRLDLLPRSIDKHSREDSKSDLRRLFGLRLNYGGPPFHLSILIVSFETLFASYGIINQMNLSMRRSDYFWLFCIAIILGSSLASFVNVSLAWGLAQKRVQWEMINLYDNKNYSYKEAGNEGKFIGKNFWIKHLDRDIKDYRKRLSRLQVQYVKLTDLQQDNKALVPNSSKIRNP